MMCDYGSCDHYYCMSLAIYASGITMEFLQIAGLVKVYSGSLEFSVWRRRLLN